jgi:hypothetical protein
MILLSLESLWLDEGYALKGLAPKLFLWSASVLSFSDL